eukprot:scaffold635_cov535-Prasinococcus_capsulatus_cf.AAC.3
MDRSCPRLGHSKYSHRLIYDTYLRLLHSHGSDVTSHTFVGNGNAPVSRDIRAARIRLADLGLLVLGRSRCSTALFLVLVTLRLLILLWATILSWLCILLRGFVAVMLRAIALIDSLLSILAITHARSCVAVLAITHARSCIAVLAGIFFVLLCSPLRFRFVSVLGSLRSRRLFGCRAANAVARRNSCLTFRLRTGGRARSLLLQRAWLQVTLLHV